MQRKHLFASLGTLAAAAAAACLFVVVVVKQLSFPVPKSSPLLLSNEPRHRSLSSSSSGATKNEGFNILVMGATVTTGAMVANSKTYSYPYLIGKPPNRVKNVALPFLGSGYASHCVESMVDDDVRYDVILLEFSQHGHYGLELLLKRLRQRYPDAIIIYIHLYALDKDVVDGAGKMPIETGKRDKGFEFRWGGILHDKNLSVLNEVSSMIKSYGGHVYELPRSADPMDSAYMFVPDWRHLSLDGHKVVATDVSALVTDLASRVGYSKEKAYLGTWGEGDQCNTWFHSGYVNLKFTGGNLVGMPTGHRSRPLMFAINFREGGTISINNDKKYPAPVLLSFMMKKNDFPKVEVTINSKTVVVDPSSSMDRFVMRTVIVGWAKTGPNVMKITPISDFVTAFRVTGVHLCGACVEFSDSVDLDVREFLG